MQPMGGTDYDADFLRTAMMDVAGAFEEVITLKRFSSRTTTPNYQGLMPDTTYIDMPTTAVVAELGVEKIAASNGVYAPGDIVLQMRLEPAMSDPASSTGGDQVVWRGQTYRVIQRAKPETQSGDWFWTAIARRVDPT